MKNLLASILILVVAGSCSNRNAVIKITELNSDLIPNSIQIKGKLLEAKKWVDKNGENLLIISRYRPKTKIKPDSSGFNGENAYLFIDQYIKGNMHYTTLWSIKDSIIDCPVDLWIGNLKNSTSITDLNSDNTTETTVVYSLICRGDVSPSNMIVSLHNGIKSYHLKGKMYSEYIVGKLDKQKFEFNLQKVVTEITDFKSVEGMKLKIGRYENVDDFKSAPNEFLDFVIKKWIDFIDKDDFLQLNGTDD